MIQMAPLVVTAGFLAVVAALIAVVGWLVVSSVRRRPLGLPVRALAGMLTGYALLLALGAAVSAEARVPLGTRLCFDDWCAAVSAVRVVPVSNAARKIVVADLRVSSDAKRVTMRVRNPQVYFVDGGGAWFRARTYGDAPSLTTPIAPGESFTTAVAAAVPAGASITAVRLWEGAWIDAWVPFGEESPFHRKTFYAVEPPR